MRNNDCIDDCIVSDLGLNLRYKKGQQALTVNNCWHYSTDGNAVDVLFQDDEDFMYGMNLIALLSEKYMVVILAFVLMDNHVHFIFYGERMECDRFMHEYIRRVSIRISNRHGEKHKLEGLSISCQVIDTDSYLKIAICYVLRNPSAAGMAVLPYDYPWSSASLMFRQHGYWSSPSWSCRPKKKFDCMDAIDRKSLIKSHDYSGKGWDVIDGLVFPGNYVDVNTAEEVFRTHKAFSYFMGLSKEEDVESKAGRISRLSISDQEMRQHKNEICQDLFGVSTVKSLNTSQRIRLAKVLKSKYQSSTKQIARLTGLAYEEIKDLL